MDYHRKRRNTVEWCNDWKEYIDNMADTLICIAVLLVLCLVFMPMRLIMWIWENFMWILMGAAGVAVTIAWLWRYIS